SSYLSCPPESVCPQPSYPSSAPVPLIPWAIFAGPRRAASSPPRVTPSVPHAQFPTSIVALSGFGALITPITQRSGTGGGDVGLHEPAGLASEAQQPPPVRLLPVAALPALQPARS